MEEKNNKDYWLGAIYESLSGEIDIETRQQLDAWLAESTENRKFYEEIVQLWNVCGVMGVEKEFDYSVAYRAFRDKVNPQVSSQLGQRPFWRYIAAAAVLVAGSFLVAYWMWNTPRPMAPLISKVTAAKGAKSQAVLQDGTIVWLNADTEIELITGFGEKERRVRLVGEAYFDVAKDAAIPFIVETAALDVKVHGTSFNVSSYPEERTIAVALVEGVVEIRPQTGATYFLKANQTTVFDTQTHDYLITDGIGESDLAWRSAKLIFKDSKFGDIVTDLQRMFDVEIVVHSKKLVERRLTGDFVNGESIQEIMEVMSALGEFTYKIHGRKVDVY